MLYAPAAARPALFALFGLDLEFASIIAGTTEPMIGEIRLAWWREALQGLDAGTVPAQPLLQLAAAEVLPRGVSGAMLAGLEDRWLAMFAEDAAPGPDAEGGALLFGLAARLLGGDVMQGEQLGAAWAGGGGVELPRVPTLLRPLLGLVRLAERDADEPPGSLGRQWRLLKAIALGR